MQETWVQFLDWEDPLEKEMATHSSILAWWIPWTEEPCGLQSVGLQESDTTEWLSLLSDLCFANVFSHSAGWHFILLIVFFLLCSFLVWCSPTYLEKAMAPHSSTLAWKIPWTEEPSRLQSMGLLRVRHDWPTSISLFTFIHWRRKWQPTPVFLPGEPQGQGSLVGCCLWSRTESDTTKAT